MEAGRGAAVVRLSGIGRLPAPRGRCSAAPLLGASPSPPVRVGSLSTMFLTLPRPIRSLAAASVALCALAVPTACGSSEGDAAVSTTESPASEDSAEEVGDKEREAPQDGGSDEGQEPNGDQQSEGEEGADGGDAQAGCDTLSQVAELEQRMNEAMVEAGDWAGVLAEVEEIRPEIASVYSRAAEDVPELADELGTLAVFTEDAMVVMQESESIEDFAAVVEEVPGGTEAADATMVIDAWTQENCGFVFAS